MSFVEDENNTLHLAAMPHSLSPSLKVEEEEKHMETRSEDLTVIVDDELRNEHKKAE